MKGGVQAKVEYMVEPADTAVAMGSGDVPVLASPQVALLCEQACVAALDGFLGPDQTSVSYRIEVAHVAPVKVNTKVVANAHLERSEGKRLVFSVALTDDCGLVAAGRITRVVMNRDCFMAKAR